jgi:hypothetical protein
MIQLSIRNGWRSRVPRSAGTRPAGAIKPELDRPAIKPELNR